MWDPATLAQLAWTGFANASFTCLFAIALSLVLKINRIWNFAQAGMMVVAYGFMFAGTRWLGLGLPAAFLLGLVGTIAMSLALERFGFRQLRRRGSSSLTFFIFTLVVSQLCTYLAELIFGTESTTLIDNVVTPVRLIGNVAVSDWDLCATATMSGLVIMLAAFLKLTRWGQRLIAVADSPDLAELYGTSRDTAYGITMALAAVLTTVGMLLLGTKAATVPSSPLQEFLVVALLATILAGVGNVFAAGAAALVVGIGQGFAVLFMPSQWQPLLVYALMGIAIVLFPAGVTLRGLWPTFARAAR
jgi:branched-subunit amino acid ABC-type transport system permease component